jgi:hypothetical protein
MFKKIIFTLSLVTTIVSLASAQVFAQSIDFTAQSSTIVRGSSTMLNMKTVGMSMCAIYGGAYGLGQYIPTSSLTNWSGYTGYLENTTVFTIFCSGFSGGVSQLYSKVLTVTVPVINVPTISFSAEKNSVSMGSYTNLSVTATGVSSCLLKGGAYGAGQYLPTLSGWSGYTGYLTSNTTFTLTCRGLDGVDYSRDVQVNVEVEKELGDIFIFQGAYQDIGDVDAVAAKLAKYKTIVLSHVEVVPNNQTTNPGRVSVNDQWTNPTACVDGRYDDMPLLIEKIRAINPSIEIFGYVSSGADAPVANDCGNIIKTPVWTCPNGFCSNFVKWTNEWKKIEYRNPKAKIDGIFIDLISPYYISTLDRDNEFAYVKALNYKIAVNAPIADYNIRFAGESPNMGAGDLIVVEGWYRGMGKDIYQASAEPAIQEGQKFFNSKQIRTAVLVTEDYSPPTYNINCNNSMIKNAYTLFKKYFMPGFLFNYQTADLGTTNKQIPEACDKSAW